MIDLGREKSLTNSDCVHTFLFNSGSDLQKRLFAISIWIRT